MERKVPEQVLGRRTLLFKCKVPGKGTHTKHFALHKHETKGKATPKNATNKRGMNIHELSVDNVPRYDNLKEKSGGQEDGSESKGVCHKG